MKFLMAIHISGPTMGSGVMVRGQCCGRAAKKKWTSLGTKQPERNSLAAIFRQQMRFSCSLHQPPSEYNRTREVPSLAEEEHDPRGEEGHCLSSWMRQGSACCQSCRLSSHAHASNLLGRSPRNVSRATGRMNEQGSAGRSARYDARAGSEARSSNPVVVIVITQCGRDRC